MKLQLFVGSLILASLINISSALGSPVSVKEPKPPCRLQIGLAHLSTSLFEKSKIRAVKVNSSSICNVSQSNVSITVEIWKTGLLGNRLVTKKTINSPGVTHPGVQVDNFNTYIICKNSLPTEYYGVSYSKALIAGKWQYARHTFSKSIRTLNCGT
jgi:hypothetical protein